MLSFITGLKRAYSSGHDSLSDGSYSDSDNDRGAEGGNDVSKPESKHPKIEHPMDVDEDENGHDNDDETSESGTSSEEGFPGPRAMADVFLASHSEEVDSDDEDSDQSGEESDEEV